MAENGRVHPNCVNASNPYHECGVACLEKIRQGKGRKDKKKSDYHKGLKEGELGKKMNGGRRAEPSCPKASNPYHNCDEFCPYRTSEANQRGVKKESGSILEATLSFGRKKKGSESQPKSSPQVVLSVPPSPPSPLSPRKKVESVFHKGQVQPSESVPVSGHLTLDRPNTTTNGSFTHFAIATPTKQEGNGKLPVSARASPFPFTNDIGKVSNDPVARANTTTNGNSTHFAIATPTKQEGNGKLPVSPRASSFPFTNDNGKVSNDPVARAMNFTFSGISGASEESDEEETHSVISESCVSIGKYHVRQNVASILQLIFDKYGDIAGSSQLESNSMRAHYLECLCSVVQELQSTTFKQLTKSKLKEMLAVLKDVESARIDVSWLQAILSEIALAMELNNQHQAAEIAKADCSHAIDSARKELESLMEDLEQKEKAVADTKAQIAEARSRLNGLELESSQLNDTMSSIWSKIEKFHSKPLADEIL